MSSKGVSKNSKTSEKKRVSRVAAEKNGKRAQREFLTHAELRRACLAGGMRRVGGSSYGYLRSKTHKFVVDLMDAAYKKANADGRKMIKPEDLEN